MEEIIYEACLKENEQLNHSYQIQSVMSASDLSIVYLAQGIENEKSVVIKEFFPKSLVNRDLDDRTLLCRYSTNKKKCNELKQSFLEEVNFLRRLSHPNIIQYIDHFEENGTVYLVMEYCQGETMERYIQRKDSFQFSTFLKEVYLPLINTLHYVHSQGIIHRDIKPKNILIDQEGNPKLIDFGSATSLETNSNKQIFTTKGYSPLELYSNQSQQGVYSDIYSMAAIIYYIVVGQPPVDAPSRVIEDKMESINRKDLNLSPWFAKKIMKSLSVHYQERPDSIASFIPVIKLEYTLFNIRNRFLKPSKKPDFN
ncbi:serine/threonine protein kinase [Ferdinandcohnia quinoae]|uniref:Serine/threonine protein kinase n=1 Tax=Fredinandcohnia quinoae TaxID=2918902 RepID=A0AAW5E7V8_9BACI|nr:serine/threonine-protein kinase [Fredinandcohnia sp. SECRCQ15]MCH1626002.1 serine/threonine protein kinase [Fredinandcohnia sp. SECRCQ15]